LAPMSKVGREKLRVEIGLEAIQLGKVTQDLSIECIALERELIVDRRSVEINYGLVEFLNVSLSGVNFLVMRQYRMPDEKVPQFLGRLVEIDPESPLLVLRIPKDGPAA